MLGSLFAFYIKNHLIISIITVVSIFGIVIGVAIFKKKIKYFLIPLTAFVFAVGIFNFKIYNFNKDGLEKPEQIQARVYSVGSPKQGQIKLKADSCVFDGKEINTNIIIYLYDNNSLFNDVEIGDIICIKPKNFYKTNLSYKNTPNSKMLTEKLKYSVTVDIDMFLITGNDKTFVEEIKQEIKTNLTGNLTNENVELAYSALFGDKELLGEEQYKAYRLSGVAHLLAVSGLHVSIIVMVISKILSMLKIKGWYNFVIIVLFLGFYAYICNFSVSVVRAGIMSLLVLLSTLFHREYDPLTSIGLAGIVVFIINPICVFDVAFLMSFGCAFGIVLFAKPIATVLKKIKITPKVADAMAITLSTLLSLLIISAYFFNNFNFISIIANLLIIPIFTVAFSFVFIVSLMSLIIPHIALILYPFNYVFDVINVLATMLGNLKFANIPTTTLNFIAIPIYFVLLFMLSRICMANHLNKIIFSLVIVAILLLCLI